MAVVEPWRGHDWLMAIRMTKGGQGRQNRRLWWDLAIALICLAGLLHVAKAIVEANTRTCNELSAKPPFSSILTCQKTYHYQPDPFTG
jgi:hypothetical protein